MPELAGRLYVPKLYRLSASRQRVVDLLEEAVGLSGGRVIFCSFPEERVAPIYIGAEDFEGHRFGVLIYPFTATRRGTTNRPSDEHRAQIRLADPVRTREELNPLAHDVAGVDVTLVLLVDPETRFLVGLDPLVYADLPMGISVYYRDEHVEQAGPTGWAVWEREKRSGTRRDRTLTDLETMVGFRPERLLDYVRFEAKASALGLAPGLRATLAQQMALPGGPHDLERIFALDASTILDIVRSNFRLGVAVRGGVAEHHLGIELRRDPAVRSATPIDADGEPDFDVTLVDEGVLVECKTASQNRYANGDFKVEVQKTRDSGAGRKYTFDQFDVLAACLFSATGIWEFRYRWARDLTPWSDDHSRIQAIQRIDDTWVSSLSDLVATAPD